MSGPERDAHRRGGADEPGPRLTERARDEREARARRLAAEMRENLLKRKRRQRALRGGAGDEGGGEAGGGRSG